MKKIILFLLMIAVFTVVTSSMCFAIDLNKIDAGGNRILAIIRRIAFWILLVKCFMDLIKAGMAGDKRQIGETILTYILLYGALFMVPAAFRLVEGIF